MSELKLQVLHRERIDFKKRSEREKPKKIKVFD